MTLRLLGERRFAGLFWTQFLGAFNDNLFKNALVILTLYRLAGENGPMLVTAAAGIFILPFFLFSATAGQLADRLPRGRLTRFIKLGEIAIMALGALALLAGSLPALFAVLFLTGAQSTLFGPIKYGILPDLLARERLMAGNALIEAATFLAILMGTIAGGLLILGEHGIPIVIAGMLGLALAGWVASLAIPPLPVAAPGLRIEADIAGATFRLMRTLAADAPSWRLSLGISWFWFVGAVFLAQLPAFTRDEAGGNEQVVTLFLTLFSLGIGTGSLLASRLTRGRIELKLVAPAALGIALFAVLLFLAGRMALPPSDDLLDVAGLAVQPAGPLMMAALFGVAAMGGLYVVPLFAALQVAAPRERRARTIAALNVLNAGFMVGSALIALALQALGLGPAAIMALAGLASLPVALAFRRPLPRPA